MGIFEQFPYVNFHELNLDWLLAKLKELSIDYEEFKKYVNDWISGANIPQLVQDVIDEMVQDGTMTDLLQSIIISDLVDGAFVTPEVYKTDNNTWTDAFIDMANSKLPVLVPHKSYDLTEYVYLSNVLGNSGIYPNKEAISPEDVKIGIYPHLRSINKFNDNDYHVQGSCIHGTTFAFISNDNNTIYLNEYLLSNMSKIRTIQVGSTSDIHGNSIEWDDVNQQYLVSSSYHVDRLYKVKQDGTVSYVSIPTGDVIDVVCKTEDGYLIGRHNIALFLCDKDLNVIREYQINNNLPPIGNSNNYTGYQALKYYKGKIYYMQSDFGYTTETCGFTIWESELNEIKWKLFFEHQYSDHFSGEEAEDIIISDNELYVFSYCRAYTHLMLFNNDVTNMGHTGNVMTVYVDESLTADGNGTSASPFNSFDEALYYGRFGLGVSASNCAMPTYSYIKNYTGRIYGNNLTLEGTWYNCNVFLNAGSFKTNNRLSLRQSRFAVDAGGGWTSDGSTGGYDHELIWLELGSVFVCRGLAFTLNDASMIPIRCNLNGVFMGDIDSNTTYKIEVYYGGFVFWDDKNRTPNVNQRGQALIVVATT